MASVNSKTLFLTTSPRTPGKMIPEIVLLAEHFSGQKWNNDSQTAYMRLLSEADFYEGKGQNDPAFSARDRINRAPKALGFVSLNPVVSLTPAGEQLLTAKRKDEVFLRQLLKFQVPSPYHKTSSKAAHFCVKPYLELLRLVRRMGTLKFDELQIFGMQLTDYHNFELIVDKINEFRKAKAECEGGYKKFRTDYFHRELTSLYRDSIASGETRTRESNDASLKKFLTTRARNMRDYADSCFRYLRATGLVAVSHVGKSLSIVPERMDDVDFILNSVSRDPVFVNDRKAYVEYLGDSETPALFTDDRNALASRIQKEFGVAVREDASIIELKDQLAFFIEQKKNKSISEQVAAIKDYRLYDDIQYTYNQIIEGELYDAPLMLEWNTWRAITMLDGGDIKANLNFDDYGNALSAASGNVPDIVCNYGDFCVCVEVTLSSGQRQYEMEGEPVTRHLGRLKKSTGKPCYCLFLAPTINDACVSHFYTLHHLNLSIYGGKSTIIPLPLAVFRKMLEDSYKADYVPNAAHVRKLFQMSETLSVQAANEREWYEQMKHYALEWLSNNINL